VKIIEPTIPVRLRVSVDRAPRGAIFPFMARVYSYGTGDHHPLSLCATYGRNEDEALHNAVRAAQGILNRRYCETPNYGRESQSIDRHYSTGFARDGY